MRDCVTVIYANDRLDWQYFTCQLTIWHSIKRFYKTDKASDTGTIALFYQFNITVNKCQAISQNFYSQFF